MMTVTQFPHRTGTQAPGTVPARLDDEQVAMTLEAVAQLMLRAQLPRPTTIGGHDPSRVDVEVAATAWEVWHAAIGSPPIRPEAGTGWRHADGHACGEPVRLVADMTFARLGEAVVVTWLLVGIVFAGVLACTCFLVWARGTRVRTGTVTVEITPDVSGFRRGIERQMFLENRDGYPPRLWETPDPADVAENICINDDYVRRAAEADE